MEELEKVTKELNGSATQYMEQQHELASTPGAHVSSCIFIRRWPSQPSVERFPFDRSNSGLIFFRWVGDPIPQLGTVPIH
jgi:hypothetical protein